MLLTQHSGFESGHPRKNGRFVYCSAPRKGTALHCSISYSEQYLIEPNERINVKKTSQIFP